MKDLISRKAVLGLAKDLCIPGKDGDYKHRSIDPIDVMELPSAEPERTMKVEKVTRVSSVIRTGRCGNCGYDVIDSYKHYPRCGAKLDWSGNEGR